MNALHERIDWCRTMANSTVNEDDCDGYVAEMAGLMDVPLAASLEAYQGRYELGCRDRKTLTLLDGQKSH